MPLALTGAAVRTMDPARPVAAGVVVEGGRIIALLREGEEPPAGAQVIDLRGACVVPGLADAHVHFPSWALALRQVRLEDVRSLAEAVARVGAAARGADPDRWLRGYGWRDEAWSGGDAPSAAALDAVTGDVPCALFSKDYHSLWLNAAALARAGGDLDVPGGVVERDAAGRATGVLREEAAWAFRERHLRPSTGEMVEAMRAALPVAARRGVTAVHDKDGWLGSLDAWEALDAAGQLTLRVWQSLPHERADDLAARAAVPRRPADRLRVGYAKAFLDGTLASRTARLLDGTGVELLSREAFEDVVHRCARLGVPVAVHAIGDAANRTALDVFAATRPAWRRRGLRPRIEHAQLLAAQDVARFAQIGVAASVQFSHAPSDRDLAERIWAGRLDGAYAYRALCDAGALLANGSDAPVEELDPVAGLRAGVLRTLDERPPWRPEQALTVQQALAATTRGPAWLAGDEDRLGRVRPGRLADLAVLDRDPVARPAEELAELRVLGTMVAGAWTAPLSGEAARPSA